MLFVGLDAKRRARVERLLIEYSLEKTVQTLPSLLPEDLARLYRSCTALFHPAGLSPWGGAGHHALACARPIVGLENVQMDAVVGPAGVYRPLLWLLVPLAAGVAFLSIEVGPRALTAVDRIGAEARREADLASIEPGRFTVFGADSAVVYGERVSAEGVMENVFLQRRLATGGIEVVVAERGEQVESDDPDTRYLVLHDGRRYEGTPGTTEFRVVEFAEHGIPYQLPKLEPIDPEPRQMAVTALLRSNDIFDVAELHWRLGVPISTVLLGFLAVPLSRSRPREGRYGRLAIGLLVFIIYFNMLSAARSWLEQGSVPAELGLWWVHAGMVLFTVGLVGLQNGWHRRMFS